MRRAFTLVELLVVITIISMLVVGVYLGLLAYASGPLGIATASGVACTWMGYLCWRLSRRVSV